MKLAIHHTPGSYSDRWLEWCDRERVATVVVDAFSSGIIGALAGCDGFLWHWQHTEPASLLAAREIIAAVEATGRAVFPSSATCRHYDDKLAQKYLLEAIGAPLVPSYAFFRRADALEWIKTAEWPRVFKLRRGAGGSQVWLVRSRDQARRFIRRAFSRGHTPVEKAGADAGVRLKSAGGGLRGALELVKRAPRGLARLAARRRLVAPERGYLYAQDFIPGNEHDTRITVIGERAFGFRRHVRPGDFRASGSGKIDHDPSRIDTNCVRIAFDVARRLGTQSLAFDFVHTPSGEPLIVEISYAYATWAVHACPSRWTPDLERREGHLWPEHAIIEDLVAGLTD